jgi:hypothetical protein
MNPRTGGDQPTDGGETDPAATTRDDGDLAVERIELIRHPDLLEASIRVVSGDRRGAIPADADAGCGFP